MISNFLKTLISYIFVCRTFKEEVLKGFGGIIRTCFAYRLSRNFNKKEDKYYGWQCKLTRGKQLQHDRIISLRVEVWSHQSSLTLPFLIEVPVPSQESERSCICMLTVSIIASGFFYDFQNAPDSVVFYCFHLVIFIQI